jgi:hypothetical protein
VWGGGHGAPLFHGHTMDVNGGGGTGRCPLPWKQGGRLAGACREKVGPWQVRESGHQG